jgi:serine/threonine protein kinase
VDASSDDPIVRSLQQVGRYTLRRKLGRGGFADVYLGEHPYLRTQVAIKIMRSFDEADVDTFLAEALLVAQLRHPHIIRVLDFDLEGETPFLVMDYAPNGTVRQRYPEGVRMEPPVILAYVEQVVDALDYIHSLRLIHRDVKPENLLLGANGEVLLSDFGITVAARRMVVRTRTIVGTVAYMAPEQIRGRPCIASDQYALGVMVYEWLCGVRPFRGTARSIAQQHLSARPPSLCERVPGLPPAVEQVVFRALAKNPRYRFESVLAFADALREAFEGQGVSTITESLPAQPVHPYQIEAGRAIPVRAMRGQERKTGPVPSARSQAGKTSFGPTTRRPKKKPAWQRRKIWREIAAAYMIDLLAVAVLSSVLAALNVPPALLELLLALCIVLLPLAAAVLRQNTWLAALTLSIAIAALALAFCLHAPIVFIVVSLALLLLSLAVAFAVSVKRPTR